MSNAIEFNQVWKKFKKGEKFNSLRDSIPNFFKNLTHKAAEGELESKEFWAVQDVNFQVKQGEVVGFIGPNGAGKSTILKLLSRIMRPTRGDMKIQGRLSALIEVTAGFHPELTGRENVYLNGTILGMKRKEIDERFNDILEFSGLKEFIDTPVKRYSSGMYSRLGFSVAAHVNPDVLLVDEVLSVGDISFQSKCAQKMREMLKMETTIILVSHNLSLIQSLCQRVMLLDQGQIKKEGPPHEVLPHYEEIVFNQKEQELRQKLAKSDFKVSVKQDTPVIISGVRLTGASGNAVTSFGAGEPIRVSVDLQIAAKIENPTYCLDIMRFDGVVCCSADSKSAGLVGDLNPGEHTVSIDMGALPFSAGIYVAKIAIWDRDMLHPYATRSKDVFKVVSDKATAASGAIFLPQFKWQLDQGGG